MQIIIDIPEDTYRATCTESMLPPDVKNVVNAIRNGIPLPKGHGDLIDRNYFIDKYVGCGSVYCEDISCNECNSRIVNKFDVDNAPAIIPADK